MSGKGLKTAKKALCLIFVLLLSINSFAAIVSDNDGSAFVTKAEFDALKDNFSNQIINYEQSIESKIDGAIAAYLAGIKLARKEIVKTSFDVLDSKNKKIIFYGKNKIPKNANNTPKAESSIFWISTTGYSASDFYHMDVQHAVTYSNLWTNTSTTDNRILVVDDGYAEIWYTNVAVKETRYISAYYGSSSALESGGLIKSIKIETTEPTEANCKSWTSNTSRPCCNITSYVQGCSRQNVYSTRHANAGYRADQAQCDVYYNSSGTSLNETRAYTVYDINWIYDKKPKIIDQWPFGMSDDYKIFVKRKVKDSEGNETKKGHYKFESGKTFTKTRLVNSRTGSYLASSNFANANSLDFKDPTGYAPILNSSKESVSGLLYKNVKDVLGEKADMAGGLFMLSNENSEGSLSLTLKSGEGSSYIFFKKSNFNRPVLDDKTNLLCEIYDEATGKWLETYNPYLAEKGKEYKIKVKFEAGAKKIFMAACDNNVSENNFEVSITQVGDAVLEII